MPITGGPFRQRDGSALGCGGDISLTLLREFRMLPWPSSHSHPVSDRSVDTSVTDTLGHCVANGVLSVLCASAPPPPYPNTLAIPPSVGSSAPPRRQSVPESEEERRV